MGGTERDSRTEEGGGHGTRSRKEGKTSGAGGKTGSARLRQVKKAVRDVRNGKLHINTITTQHTTPRGK